MHSDIPKVLHPVCGKPMMQYVVDVARKLRSLKIYVILGFKNEVVREALGRDLQVVIQKKLLGTADAIRSAAPFFRTYRGDVLILSGDTPLLTQETVRQVVQKHRSSSAECTFLTATVLQPQGYGRVIRDGRGKVVAIREEKDSTPREKEINEINVGVYCFYSKRLFALLKAIKLNPKKKEFYLTDIIALLVQKKATIETVETKDFQEGLGINTRKDLSFAESVIRKKNLWDFMLQGVTIIDPQTTYIDADVKIGRDTVIRPLTVIEKNVHIGGHCSIGPFCRLRPGTRIADGVEIGNFTEVSRTQISKGSLMKHFGFLGDARIGTKVNIGAGTVTANYDGKNKNITVISDEAFIGSDSILVAPVKVGKKAATGAGSVVTSGHNVPDGKVAVGLPARIIARRKF